MICLEVWVKAPVELSEADMTLYPEPHNARAVVRDSCGRGLPADAIAQTLSLSVMSPSGGVKTTNAEAASHRNWNGYDPLNCNGCHAQVAVLRFERVVAGPSLAVCMPQAPDLLPGLRTT